jgi:hypothetical protein
MRDRSRPEENPPGGNRLAIQDHFSQRPVSSEGRQAPRAYSRLSAALMKILALPDLDGRLITGAVVQKIREQLPDYWLRRAEEFEAAAPRPGDYHGTSRQANRLVLHTSATRLAAPGLRARTSAA